MKAHIVLIPKCPEPLTPKDYRPISIDNTLYMLFTKLLFNRLMPFIPWVVSPEQTIFVKGRNIADNTILMKEVLHSFKHEEFTCKAFVMKADINKAFDTLE
jgi:Reverse transcriptase (RNA-dependent DNA polymerase)